MPTVSPDIVLVCSFFPIPEDRGDPLRVNLLIEALARVGKLHVLAVRRESTTAQDICQFHDLHAGVALQDFPAEHLTGWRGRALRWTRSALRTTPPWIIGRYSYGIADELQRLTGSTVVVLAGEAAGGYVGAPPSGCHIHWDKSNVLSTSTRLDVRSSRKVGEKLRRIGVAALSCRYESRVLGRCSSVSVTSEEEAARLKTATGRAADFVWKSGVARTEAPVTFDPCSKDLLWLGSLDYASNREGLLKLLDETRDVLSTYKGRIVVVGSGGGPELITELGGFKSVLLRGFVSDLSSVARTVRGAVVPLWTGAGVKLKTATLLEMGLPVSGTPAAFEGIDDSVAVTASSNSLEIVRSLLSADEDELRRRGRRGRAWVHNNLLKEKLRDEIADDFSHAVSP